MTTADLDEKYAALIKERCSHGDKEGAHVDADMLLTQLLAELGCIKTIEAFDAVDKWYA